MLRLEIYFFPLSMPLKISHGKAQTILQFKMWLFPEQQSYNDWAPQY
jgi:hypothetical protein